MGLSVCGAVASVAWNHKSHPASRLRLSPVQLGLDWADKKSISRKFGNASGVTALCWPSAAGGDLVFGGADGRVRLGQIADNRPATLFASGSYVVSMAASPAGNAVLSGHLDGAVYLTLLDHVGSGEVPALKLLVHSCPPTALAWGAAVCCAGSDGRVSFYDVSAGTPLRTFDYSGDASVKAFSVGVASPTGEAVVVGNFNKFMVYALEGASPGSGGGAAAGGAGAASSKSKGSILGLELKGSDAGASGGAGSSGAGAGAGEWREASVKTVDGLYSVTALGWKADGSKVAVGSLCGAVDLYDACLKRVRYKGRFDFTYVSPSTVIVKRLATGVRIVLRSSFSYEVRSIRIFRDRFMVAATARTLLVGDLESCRLSEVPWDGAASGSGAGVSSSSPSGRGASSSTAAGHAAKLDRDRPRFYFESPQVAMVHRAGEATIIEYGRPEALGTVRTEHLSPHTVSVRIAELPPAAAAAAAAASGGSGSGDAAGGGAAGGAGSGSSGGGPQPTPVGGVIRVLAYLLDAATIRILDLNTGSALATVSHDARVDWLELNARGRLLLFRDKRRRLHLYDVGAGARHTLLPHCSYAQWVPDSDVVVAQRRGTLCVWYSIRHPDRVTHYDIRGDVEDIVRGGGKTEVLVDEGVASASYLLDEGLIAFGGAMECGDFAAAVATLEGLDITPETAGMWAQLGDAALAAGNLPVAERAAVALGDTCRARWLRRTSKIAASVAESAALMGLGAGGGGDPARNHWRVRSRLLQLRGELAAAEAALLEAGRAEDAVALYAGLQEWDEALAVADAHGLPSADSLRGQCMDALLSSGQEDRAAAIREREGDLPGAAALYLKGGLPAKAAALVAANPSAFPRDLLERVTAALAGAGMYARAGVLLERLGDAPRALESYVRGHAWRQAVDLARRAAPGRVTELERRWGEWLVSQRQPDAAVDRFIEAGAHADAIGAAIAARQFARAAELVAATLGSDPAAARPFWRRLAAAAVERGALDEAESLFLRAGDGRAAVRMHMEAGRPEAAHRVARAVMPDGEVTALFAGEASRLEAAGSLRAAEKVLLCVGAVDAAAAMYTRARAWDALLRFTAAHRPAKLRDARLQVAAACAADGLHRQAEAAYVEAGEWEHAVAMYRSAGAWDDAMRVARTAGGPAAAGRVAYAQALSLGPEAGMALLKRLGQVEAAVDFAIETRQWDAALELATRHAPAKVSHVHLKHGIALEDEGAFAAAEAAFVAAERPREAVDMHLHLKDWAAALRVAEAHEPGAIPDVLIAQANASAADRDWAAAEALFLEARRPDLAVDMFLTARNAAEALRVAQRHIPHRLAEVTDRIKKGGGLLNDDGGGGSGPGSPEGGAGSSSSGPGQSFRDPATRRAAAVAGAMHSGSSGLARPAAAQAVYSGAGSANPTGAGAGAKSGSPRARSAAGAPVAVPPGGDALTAGRDWEAEGQIGLAVDAYLSVGGAVDGVRERPLQSCRTAWLRAVALAEAHEGAPGFSRRHVDVAEEVAHRLADAGDAARAGALFESIGQADQAAHCYVQARQWERARAAAGAAGPRVRETVEAAYRSALSTGGAGAGSASGGHALRGPGRPKRRGALDDDDDDDAGESSLGASGTFGESSGGGGADGSADAHAYAHRDADADADEESDDGSALEAQLRSLASAGAWERLFEAAARGGSAVLARHLYPRVAELLTPPAHSGGAGAIPSTDRVTEAVALLAKYGAPAVSAALPVARRLVTAAFGCGSAEHPLPDASLSALRDVLYKLSAGLRKQGAGAGPGTAGGAAAGAGSGGDADSQAEADRLLLAVHYAVLRARCTRGDIAAASSAAGGGGAAQAKQQLADIAARLSLSSLRFAGGLIPADRAFYEAGMACQRAGPAWRAPAFVCLNRFVDIVDAVEDAETEAGGGGGGGVSAARGLRVPLSHLPNGDFMGTGVPPPADFAPLQGHWVRDTAAREEARRWVLEESAGEGSGSARTRLPTRPCFSCGEPLFEGALGCASCKATFPPCVVTGYPIPASQATACGGCGSRAIKTAWSTVVSRTKACPWCSAGGAAAVV